MDGEQGARPVPAEPWVSSLRALYIDAGHDAARVDEALGAALARFRSARTREFVPLLVERSVGQALRSEDGREGGRPPTLYD
jgi:hypothetical protein